MQNALFLVLLRPIFALKAKIASPYGIVDESWSRTCSDIDQKNWVSARMKTFSFLFFFEDHLNLDRKTDSIRVRSNENLGQDRLMLFPASKTAPQFKFLATRLFSDLIVFFLSIIWHSKSLSNTFVFFIRSGGICIRGKNLLASFQTSTWLFVFIRNQLGCRARAH